MVLMLVISTLLMAIVKGLPQRWHDFLYGNHNNMPFFNMLNVLFGGAMESSELPVRNFARVLLVIWLWSTLVLRNAYQGKLFDNLRKEQRNDPLFNIEAIYQSKMNIYVFESYYQNIADHLPTQLHR